MFNFLAVYQGGKLENSFQAHSDLEGGIINQGLALDSFHKKWGYIYI